MRDEIRILFLAADPSDQTRTRLCQELQTIKDELRRGSSARRFVLEVELSVKIEDMTRAVHEFRPHLVHFSGHGSLDGELCFEDTKGETQKVAPEGLERFFSRLSGEVDCVVLNACYSENQARMICQYLPYVVGTRGVITEPVAIRFSQGFYQALSGGRALPEAFEFGRAFIEAMVAGGPLEPNLIAGPDAERRLVGSWGKPWSDPPPAEASAHTHDERREVGGRHEAKEEHLATISRKQNVKSGAIINANKLEGNKFNFK